MTCLDTPLQRGGNALATHDPQRTTSPVEYHRLPTMERVVAESRGNTRRNVRILLVEDEPSISGFVRRGLHFEGYEVDVVPDGPGALRKLRDNPPDLLVLDVMVPGVDGFEIARRLRAAETAERLPAIPILMLTARDAVADRVKIG